MTRLATILLVFLASPAFGGWAVVDKSSGLVQAWQRAAAPAYDSAMHAVVEVSDPPDVRSKRWDGAAGLRDATAQELAAYDAAKLDADALASFDSLKVLKALGIVIAPKLQPPMTPAQLRQAVIDQYKALP